MKLVDSVGWIEFFAKGPLSPAYREEVLKLPEVVVPTVVIYEVSKRILGELGENAASEASAQMQRGNVVPLDATLATTAAQVSLMYKLPMADAIIYATAQAFNAELVTSDAHFQGLPGVEFIARP